MFMLMNYNTKGILCTHKTQLTNAKPIINTIQLQLNRLLASMCIQFTQTHVDNVLICNKCLLLQISDSSARQKCSCLNPNAQYWYATQNKRDSSTSSTHFSLSMVSVRVYMYVYAYIMNYKAIKRVLAFCMKNDDVHIFVASEKQKLSVNGGEWW